MPLNSFSVGDMTARIVLKVGEEYNFSLEGLGSAGYSWTFRLDGPSDVVSVSMTAAQIPLKPKPGELPPGNYSINELVRVQAKKVGSILAHFVLSRSWEKNNPPLKEYDLVIRVIK